MNSPLNLVRGFLGGAALVFIMAPLPVRAEVEALYTAPGNPLQKDSNWKASGRTTGGAEVETPELAWRIAPEKGQALSYFVAEPKNLLRKAFAEGWKYTARVRLDPGSLPFIGRYVASLGVENAENHQAFVAWICTNEAHGGLQVEINRKVVPLPGLSPTEFHEYAITYDPATATASLTVDGETVAGSISPEKTDRWFLRWGHQSGSIPGAAEWASVKFESPVPR